MNPSRARRPAPLWVLALAAASAAAAAAAAERILTAFPVEVACGVESAPPGVGAALSDLPFDPARGYGHVGGKAGAAARGGALGGDAHWPLRWREGARKYAFRVPNGEYLVRLVFIETEVAAPGLRVFDVRGEEARLFAAVDPVAEAGDFAWFSREGLVEVRDGWLDLELVPASGSRPARVSRIRVEPAQGVPAAPDAPSSPRLDAGPQRVVVRWDAPPRSPGIAGYGVFASESPSGPFESLTPRPVATPWFVDERRGGVGPGFYRIRAYGVRGGQSPLTEPLPARAAAAGVPMIPTLELRFAEGELGRLLARADPQPAVPGTLLFRGASHAVEVACLGGDERWQAKKSFRVRIQAGGRQLGGRREILLLAESGDPTLLREKLACDLDRALGLASPEATFVHVLLNGRSQGIYLDREVLGAAFRRRAGLDRFGSLYQVPGRLRLHAGWEPYGQARGQAGDLRGLTHLVHELNRLDEPEVEAWFEERFYLDRLIDRLAACALRGGDPALEGAEPPRRFLDDSRNGRYELFADERRGGDFGVEDFELPRTASGPERARRALLGWSIEGGARGGSWRALETRLLARPALRERYLARVEELAGKLMTPERFTDLLSLARAPLAAALFAEGEAAGGAPRDLRLWPYDGGAAFRGAPQALGEFQRSHARALLDAVAQERARPPEPVVLSELCLRPAADPAWIEIQNRSREPVDLARYRLTLDLDRPDGFRFPPGAALGPGERRIVTLGEGPAPGGARAISCPLRPSPSGGELGLFRAAPGGSLVPADLLHYGHQTAGFSLARLPDGSPRWGSTSAPSPGDPNQGRAAAAPPWRYRSGVEVKKSGERVLWVQWSAESAGAIAGASIHLRDQGSPGFEPQDLAHNRETYRWEYTLGAERLARRPDYYYSARSPDGVERLYPLPGPELPFRPPAAPPITLNELLPRPSRGGPHREFVELWNAGDAPVSADGLFLTDDRRNPVKFRLTARDPIPAKGFLLVYTDGRAEGLHANFRLGNAGEYLGLFGRYEEGNVLIDQVAFPAVPVDRSYGREREGAKGFKVWKDPTPGARNIPKIPPEFLKKREGGKDAPKVEEPPEPPAAAKDEADDDEDDP